MTIGERLEVLVKSTESLLATAQELTRQMAEQKRKTTANEREMQRFRRAMRAALKAWLEEEGENGQQK